MTFFKLIYVSNHRYVYDNYYETTFVISALIDHYLSHYFTKMVLSAGKPITQWCSVCCECIDFKHNYWQMLDWISTVSSTLAQNCNHFFFLCSQDFTFDIEDNNISLYRFSTFHSFIFRMFISQTMGRNLVPINCETLHFNRRKWNELEGTLPYW